MAHDYVNRTVHWLQYDQYDQALLIDLTTTRISVYIRKGKLIIHDILFNMATGIQIKFHQDIMTHILMTIMNVK